ncbi:hypothetical protein FKM82_011724 [Ascaphus truei]
MLGQGEAIPHTQLRLMFEGQTPRCLRHNWYEVSTPSGVTAKGRAESVSVSLGIYGELQEGSAVFFYLSPLLTDTGWAVVVETGREEASVRVDPQTYRWAVTLGNAEGESISAGVHLGDVGIYVPPSLQITWHDENSDFTVGARVCMGGVATKQRRT